MNKQELLNKLTSSEELIRTVFVPISEVIVWVNELEEEETSSVNFDELTDLIVGEIVDQGVDLIEDYDLEMNYREVEISSITLDEDRVKRAIERAIEEQKNA